jgi:hypothetical protein
MESFDHLPNEDDLKAENEFLKMKLMLEHGASFSSNESELPPEMENEFLNSVMAFEKQFEQYKTIKVYDKIGRPSHFKPASEIPDEEIDKAWSDLRAYLNERNIDLDACSPNISTRELYRFTTEELFEHETDDMDLPGWTTNFIYDEFHPDPVYDNTRVATEDCISCILQKEPMEWTHHFQKEGLRLNKHTALPIDEFKDIVNRFKMAYDEIEINEIAESKCVVDDELSTVTGAYSINVSIGTEKQSLSGTWEVLLHFDKELGYWYVAEVAITGIDF